MYFRKGAQDDPVAHLIGMAEDCKPLPAWVSSAYAVRGRKNERGRGGGGAGSTESIEVLH